MQMIDLDKEIWKQKVNEYTFIKEEFERNEGTFSKKEKKEIKREIDFIAFELNSYNPDINKELKESFDILFRSVK